MMRGSRSAFHAIVAAITLAVAQHNAAAAQDVVRFLQEELSDQLADQVLASVVANLPRARGEDGNPLPPLSEADLTTPLLDRALVKEVMDVGVASGIGQACSLDWQNNNFLPLMRRERARGDRSPHQIAAIAMVHGVMQNQVATVGGCGPNGAAGAAAFYERKWRAQSE